MSGKKSTAHLDHTYIEMSMLLILNMIVVVLHASSDCSEATCTSVTGHYSTESPMGTAERVGARLLPTMVTRNQSTYAES